MSGHSKWKTIKHKKEAIDQKRGKLFSKLLNAVAIAAKTEPNPEFNPRLRAAIEKARAANVPQDNIERAVKRSDSAKDLEELIIEAYGPEGAAILIEAVTDNKNRTIAEVKKILGDAGAKFAEAGSVRWAFEPKDGTWRAKFRQGTSLDAQEKIKLLVEELESRDDIQAIYSNS